MRITSGLFVAAHIRRCAAAGINAVVVRRGAESAGAIFVVVDRLDGTVDLYAPAPQTAFESRAEERLFQRIAEMRPSTEVDDRLRRETRFDPDLWVVAIEDRGGRSLLETVGG